MFIIYQGENTILSPLLTDTVELASSYRVRKKEFELKSVHPAEVQEEETKGWELQYSGKRKSRLKRRKTHDQWLEDRLWCLFYGMGYRVLNGKSFKISFTRPKVSIGTKQVDVYAEDDETAVVIECKSSLNIGRRSLQKDIQETSSLQSKFRNSIINSRFKNRPKPKIIWIYATNNILWSTPDIERAQSHDINIVTENELQYFEIFLKHMGPAGRYQILGEFLKGQKIPGLSDVKLPAIRGKIGGETYYSFVATPRKLLKIAFINHQALNHPDGRPAYQRMISASRIKDISQFIEKGGYFPTNILVNFSDEPRFDQISNKENTDPNIKFGWITLPSRYRSAWIIDGQHRLYGFSHLTSKFLDQSLFVLAFSKMSVEKEADLFININSKQKSVPRGLLVSLLADIRMGDSDPSTALSALGSAVQRALDGDETGPLAGRFAKHGMPAEPRQNLTVAEVVKGLRRSALIGKVVGKTLAPGPLSGTTDKTTIARASKVLNTYFEWVRTAHPQRWEAGREAYISNNPGIRAHLVVIAEVVSYLSHKKSLDFGTLKAEDFASYVTEFCQPIFTFIEKASDDEIESKFSRQFGEGGVKTYAYRLMRILIEVHPDFGSDEFRTWVEQSNSEKIEEGNRFLMKLSERLTDYVIDTLKKIHGTHRLESGEQAFWELGVESHRVRNNAYNKQQDDKERRKPKEGYLDILDLQEIVKQKNNWDHFEHVFNNPMVGERGGKKYYLDWIREFNELRKIAAHKNQVRTYTDNDLEFIEWLRTEVSPKIPIPE
ncbi:MAG: DGQHR domain-containing protein [Candidatus Dadabacteria bacterium]|nr:DGQHR domain-containing protein [Candidatus Dadabacteria bacterium]MYK49751.1 DGQHR domain-containing protein [Candidatus Dadabacteria bacterium]